MIELDDRLLRDLARLRVREGPPGDAEDRVLAALQTEIGGGPSGGGEGGPGGSELVGVDMAFAAKVIAATAAMTSAGLLLIKLGASALAIDEDPQPRAATRIASPPTLRERSEGSREPVEPEPEPAPTRVSPSELEPVEPTKRARVVADELADPPLDADPLAAELALLEQARADEDPDERLRLLDRHRDRFPSGALAAERDVLRITTLCELDRVVEARRAAEGFLSAHPRSPLRSRLRSGCPELE
ncbi:hypothetical protein ACNOYE_10755 [Nannocystaceae bacterium ST9]